MGEPEAPQVRANRRSPRKRLAALESSLPSLVAVEQSQLLTSQLVFAQDANELMQDYVYDGNLDQLIELLEKGGADVNKADIVRLSAHTPLTAHFQAAPARAA